MIILSGVLFSLAGCTSAEESTVQPGTETEEIVEEYEDSDAHFLLLKERDEPTWAGISQSNRFGSIDTDFFIELTDSETLQFIVDEMIEGSAREAGIVNVAEPYYGLQLDYADGSKETFHLWVTKDDTVGTIMDTTEPNYIYTFSEEVSDRFFSILPEESILE